MKTDHELAKQQIENLLDRYGWTSFLLALSDVCGEKAEHIRSNWHDENLAIEWDHRSDMVDSLTSKD